MNRNGNGESKQRKTTFENAKHGRRSDSPDPIQQALEAYLSELEECGKVDRTAFLARYPTLGDELVDQLDGIEWMFEIGPKKAGPAIEPLATLGDFRIVRELGRGGMGIVFEAEQLSMGRQVALKVLPFVSMVDSRALLRFKNEVRAVAALDHPHIVPIYSVGEERGVHYYAMRLIQGQSLSQLIVQLRAGEDDVPDRLTSLRISDSKTAETAETTPHVQDVTASSKPPSVSSLSEARGDSRQSYARAVASLGIQAAEALQFAHEQGIVHRDIKPANLLLDYQNRFWITDFGLARIEAEQGLTMTGDMVGTLTYMSPEQALSDDAVVDHRTDIYSLGATLYELLALSPAVSGPNRKQILDQLAEQEPRSLRRIDASIPSDLELIVLKAMSKVPEDRYRTAGEFAQDLQNFLEHRALIAKPLSVADRVTKWSRRNRTFVTAAVTVLLIASIVSIISVALLAGKNRLLARQQQITELERNNVKRLLAYERLEHGLQMLSAGNSQGLKSLVRAREEADDLPEIRQVIERMWTIGYGQSLADAPFLPTSVLPAGKVAAFSPDGGMLAIGSDGEQSAITCWDTLSGKQYGLPLKIDRPRQIAFSPDKTMLAAISDENEVHVWNLKTSESVTTLSARFQDGQARSSKVRVAFSSSGTDLMVAQDGTLKIWSTDSWQPQSFPISHQDQITNISFSPDRRLLATASEDGTAQLWDVRSGASVGNPMRHLHPAQIVRFSRDGKLLATGTAAPTVRIWDVQTQEKVSELSGTAWPLDIDFSPDGTLLTTGLAVGVAEVWDVRASRLIDTLRHNKRVSRVAFCPHSRLLVTSTQDGTYFWDCSGKTPQLLTQGPKGGVLCSPDGAFVVIQDDAGTMLWTKNPAFIPLEKRITNATAPTIVNHDGTLIAGFVDGQMLMWETSTGELLGKPQQFDNPVVAASFLPNSNSVGVILDDAVLQILQLRTRAPDVEIPVGKTIHPIPPVFHPKLPYVATRTRKIVTVWDIDAKKPLLTSETPGAQSLAFSPDGNLLALGTQSSATVILQIPSGSIVKKLEASERVASVGFSEDGRQLAIGTNDGKVTVWNTHTWEQVSQLEHPTRVGAVALNSDGNLIAAATRFFHGHPGDGNRVYVWDVSLRSRPMRITLRHEAGRDFDPVSLTFDPRGDLICTSSDGTAYRWDLSKPPSGLNEMRSRTAMLLGLDPGESHLALDVGEAGPSLGRANSRRRFSFPNDFVIPAETFTNSIRSSEIPSENGLEELQEALRMAEFVVSMSPTSANHWTNLGVAHYRLGDWRSTIDAMETAVPLTDQIRGSMHVEQYLLLALAHWRLGHRAKAREYYQQATRRLSDAGEPDRQRANFIREATELFKNGDDAQIKLTPTIID